MINYDEIKENTLAGILDFMKDINEGEYYKYDTPISFTYIGLNQESQQTVINNESEFAKFLSYLHRVYRKIEMKMENAGYPSIIPDSDSRETSFMKLCVNLDKAKEDYKLMNRNGFLEMYPVLKNLFLCYNDYIAYSIAHLASIDEGKYLSGTINELRSWLEQLNTWFPAKVNGEWINSNISFIAIPSGFSRVVRKLFKIEKFKNFPIFEDNEISEPYFKEENSKNILFGFVNMEGARADRNADNSNILELECPKECTMNIRRWICMKCGDYVTNKQNNIGQQFLFCSCGSTRYNDELLICYHPSHQLQNINRKQHEDKIVHPPVPDIKESQTEVINSNSNLPLILRQLEKIQLINEDDTHPKIFNALFHLLKNDDEKKIRNALKKLKDIILDEDTDHLIDCYLKDTN